ncbi:beta-ketoacyl synthase N-terminal-like domain-containing protein [Streptomyces sp. NPDC058371]|uniref:beta-ketoacyl synthase N-terminal-like domain-containing protein n=1 Tax=Streptomyces sp. NPDC058371 TaxID=3346463 RepID=UPI0036512680
MRPTHPQIRGLVVERLGAWYGLAPEEVADDRPLAELGLTSRDAVALTALLSDLAGRRLPDTLLWDAGTIDALARELTTERPGAPTPEPGKPHTPVPAGTHGQFVPGGPDTDVRPMPGFPGPRREFVPGTADPGAQSGTGPPDSVPAAVAPDTDVRPVPGFPGPRREFVPGTADPGAQSGTGPPDSVPAAVAADTDVRPVPGFPGPRGEFVFGAPDPGAQSGTARPESVPAAPACVAVVGLGCRFPGGADSPEAYWRLLTEGRDAVGTVPAGRWDPFAVDPEVSRHGAFLDDIAGFDAEFFGIGAHEAAAMDPQQRMLLEVTREALDHAALSVTGTRTGVFVGISGNEYAHLTAAAPDAWTATGAALSIAAGRLSYALDLRGPSLAVDTACSSSLVAVHHAVRSLLTGECDAALAAGANLLLTPAVTLSLQRAGALAPDGRCKAFDATADGIVRGEGCGVVVLKRLADAERDGDRVLAVIRATAVNSDGRSNGLTAPSAAAQRTLLAEVHPDPATVDYVEAHGTGTALGDPIEAGALGAVLGTGRALEQPLLIGSVKTNLGHLEAAAGIAGLIKTVLALHHGEIPPQLHYTGPGPHADLDALGLRVVTESEPWPRYSGTATAGVSAFGFGGTNAHVVLAEHRANRRTSPPGARPALLLLDGPTGERVRSYAGELAGRLAETPRVRDADLARTFAGRTGRGHHRAAVVTRDRAETVDALRRLAAGEPSPHVVTGTGTPGGPGPVWIFSGYGSQWPGMARQLLTAEPAFADAVERLDPLLLQHASVSLTASLEPDADLSSPATVMPALYGVQLALAQLWRSYGPAPAAVIGHSLGEIAAAVVSGAVDPVTGARIVAVRSRLLAGLTGGAMAVVDRSEGEIRASAGDLPSIQVAVHASPVQSVVTGAAEEVAEFVARVTADGGFARPLGVSGAGHSPEVEPLLGEFARELGEVRSGMPACPRYSSVLDDPRDPAPYDTAYWVANLRRPVRFVQAVRAAVEDGHRVFLEVAPHATQLHPLTDTLPTGSLIVPTLRRNTDDALTFRTSLATLLVNGVRVDGLRERLDGRIVDVPPPRWRHRRFWFGEEPETARTSAHPAQTDAGPLERLRGCVAAVMGYSPERIDPDLPLTDLGLDSLTAVRIRGSVEREFGVELEPGVLLRRGTLRSVADLLEADADLLGVEGTSGTLGGAEPLGADARRLGAESFPGVRASAPVPSRPGASSPAPPLKAPLPAPDPASSGPTDTLAAPLRRFPNTGPGTPLFLAHAAGGSSAVYARLAERLDGQRPLYGFDRQADPDDVPGRAAEFARRVREACPDGPWLVGGWSYGGVLAQEAARLLSRHGTVHALVLIDSVLPLAAPPCVTRAAETRRRFADFAAYVARTYAATLDLPYDELAGLDDTEAIDLVLKVLGEAVDLPASVLEHQRTSYLDLRSGERHRPARYEGRTLLYRASEPAPHTVHDPRYERDDAALGWDAHCADLTVTPLPGHHLSLLDPPVVDTLARLLTRDLGARTSTDPHARDEE